jgi:hypothetical protein
LKRLELPQILDLYRLLCLLIDTAVLVMSLMQVTRTKKSTLYVVFVLPILQGRLVSGKNPQNCGLNNFLRLADLLQMLHFADFLFRVPIFFSDLRMLDLTDPIFLC